MPTEHGIARSDRRDRLRPDSTVRVEEPASLAPAAGGNDLFVAIALNNTDRVSWHLETHPGAVHTRNGEGKTPFYCAIESGHLEAAELLLRHGAAIDACTPCGTTPLHRAAGQGRIDLLRFLLERGADVNAKDVWKVTPRERALRMGHRAAAHLLVSADPAGSDPRSSQADDENLWLVRTRLR